MSLKVEKNISTFKKILAANRFMPYLIILINNRDIEFIADEEILSANNTLNTSLTTLEASILVVRDNEE